MSFDRKVVRGGLLVALSTAIGVSVVALRQEGGTSPNAWAAIAAALAVLAAIVSAWTSQRLVELQEDALEPNPEPSFDARSRYQLIQFRIANRGQSTAYDIRIDWDRPVANAAGEPIRLGPNEVLPVRGPQEAFSVLLGASHEFFGREHDTTYAGTLSFSNASGERRTKRFVVTAEHERTALVHNEEEPRTHYELQQLPDRLSSVANELAALRRSIIEAITPRDS